MAGTAVSSRKSNGKVKAEEQLEEPVAKKARTSRGGNKAAPVRYAESEEEEVVDTKPKKGSRVKKEEEDEDAKDTAPKKPRSQAKSKGKDADSASKPRGKASIWPPTDLDPSLHPPRAGYPIFELPVSDKPLNGGIPSSTPGPRPHYLGAHTSIAGGPATALYRAGKAGANGLALFVKSQRQWKSNPFEQESIDRFKQGMKSVEEGGMGYGPETILVHGSYLINLGNPDPNKWNTSYACFKDDIERCQQLGVKLYNWQ